MAARNSKLSSYLDRIRAWLRRSSIYLTIAFLVFLFFVILLADHIFITIHSGEEGVRWARFTGGTVLDRIYSEGTKMIPPWDEIFIYNMRIQETHDQIVVLSSNGLPMTVNYSCRFHPDPNRLPSLHDTYGPDYAETLIRPEIVSSLREVIGNYRPEELYARSEQGLLDEIFSVLQSHVTDQFVILDNILIKGLRLTPELENAINQKLVMEQTALAYEFRLKSEESEKQRKGIEAQGLKDFQMISGVDAVKWRALQATEELAKSPNSKIIVVGNGSQNLPVILNSDK